MHCLKDFGVTVRDGAAQLPVTDFREGDVSQGCADKRMPRKADNNI